MKNFLVGLFVVLAFVLSVQAIVSFEGHKVVEVELKTVEELVWLRSLPDEETDGVKGVDCWSNDGVLLLGKNTIRLTPIGFKSLQQSSISFTIKNNNLAETMKQQNEHKKIQSAINSYDPKDQWFYNWRGYSEIQAKLKEFSEAHSNIMTFIPSIGVSHEGRNISGVKIAGKNPVKRVFFIAGTHAREWIAEGVSLWAIASIAEQYDTNAEVKQLVDSLEIYIVPCYNPDGYEYSRATNRYWRKNRRVNGDGTFGVDQNRNWEPNWSGSGSSKSTSSDTYCGPSVMSEPEVKAMHDWLGTFTSKGGISGLIDMHSNAQLFLRPWAYTNALSPDEAMDKTVGDTFVSKLKSVHGTSYQSIRSAQLYIASGTAGDGAYQLGVKKSFVIELAGNDFVVPESDIQKQGEEVFEALLYFMQACLQ